MNFATEVMAAAAKRLRLGVEGPLIADQLDSISVIFSAVIIAAEDLRQAVEEETAALEAIRHNVGVDAAKTAESRVTECSGRLSEALAIYKGITP